MSPRRQQLWKLRCIEIVTFISLFLFFGREASVPFTGFDAELAAVLPLLWWSGHCDSLDGPVISLARKALETGNVNYVLPWVHGKDEPEIRHAFDHAAAVRRLGPEAQDLADTHFFETLVRVHRASEGAYAGLKPAGLDLEPAVPAADKSLETGSVDALTNMLTEAVREGIHRLFHDALHARNFDINDVVAGRRYVEAYVAFVHYVEGIWSLAKGKTHGHHDGHEHHSGMH